MTAPAAIGLRWSRPALARPPWLAVAVGAEGLVLAWLVGREGSPGWQALRVGIVLAVALWPPARPVAVPAFGLVGTAVGIGIGLPHLAKGGLGVVTVVGLASLGLGLVLLVVSFRRLAGLVPGWWRIPAVGVAGVVTVVALWSASFAVAATNVPPLPLGERTAASVGLAAEDVWFPATDGVRLSGWLVPGTNGAGVVLLHGSGSTRTSVLDHAAVLSSHGYTVLAYDARGHGRSHGRAMDFGWYGDADLGGAVSYLAGRPEVDGDRIGVVGLSMGGEQALGAAATDRRIRAVVAEGATHRVASDSDWLLDRYGFRGGVQRAIDWLTYGVADLLTAAGQPAPLAESVAAIAPRPVLLITAGRVADEGHAAAWFEDAAPAAVERWDVPGAGHTDALATDPAGWERRVVAFLDGAGLPLP